MRFKGGDIGCYFLAEDAAVAAQRQLFCPSKTRSLLGALLSAAIHRFNVFDAMVSVLCIESAAVTPYLLAEDAAVATQRQLLCPSKTRSLMGASSVSSSSLVRFASCVLQQTALSLECQTVNMLT